MLWHRNQGQCWLPPAPNKTGHFSAAMCMFINLFCHVKFDSLFGARGSKRLVARPAPICGNDDRCSGRGRFRQHRQTRRLHCARIAQNRPRANDKQPSKHSDDVTRGWRQPQNAKLIFRNNFSRAVHFKSSLFINFLDEPRKKFILHFVNPAWRSSTNRHRRVTPPPSTCRPSSMARERKNNLCHVDAVSKRFF